MSGNIGFLQNVKINLVQKLSHFEVGILVGSLKKQTKLIFWDILRQLYQHLQFLSNYQAHLQSKEAIGCL